MVAGSVTATVGGVLKEHGVDTVMHFPPHDRSGIRA